VGCKLATLVGADLQRWWPVLGLALQWSGARSLVMGEPVVGQHAHFLLCSHFAGPSSDAMRVVWPRACQRRGCVLVGILLVRAFHLKDESSNGSA
jgi:hypothetical protein